MTIEDTKKTPEAVNETVTDVKADVKSAKDQDALDSALDESLQASKTKEAEEDLEKFHAELQEFIKKGRPDFVIKFIHEADEKGIDLDLPTILQTLLDNMMIMHTYEHVDNTVLAFAAENSIELKIHQKACQKTYEHEIRHGIDIAERFLEFAEKHGIQLDLSSEEVANTVEDKIKSVPSLKVKQAYIDYAKEHNILPDLEKIFVNQVNSSARRGEYINNLKDFIDFAKKNGVEVAPTKEALQQGLIYALHHRFSGSPKKIEEFAKNEYGYTIYWPKRNPHDGSWTEELNLPKRNPLGWKYDIED